MTAHRIQINRDGQLEDEIWADSARCQAAITDLLQPGTPGTVVDAGPVPEGAETSADTWCGSCGDFMWHGADCGCPDKTAPRPPIPDPPFAAACPECGDEATHTPPEDLVPWEAHGLDRPQWSHTDRSALCPVIGPSGYQPAQPQPASAMACRSAPEAGPVRRDDPQPEAG